MADGKSETSGGTGTQAQPSLGAFLTAARKEGGYTAEQVAAGTHIPAHYVKAIETDDYGMISDQLYLLPFLRRYAAFIGLDPEDVASRFVREVQRSEVTATKIVEPIPMISNERKQGGGRYAVVIVILLAIAGLAALVIVNRPAVFDRILHFSGKTMPTAEPPQASPEPTTASQTSASEPPPTVIPTPPPAEPTVIPTPAPRPHHAPVPLPPSDSNIE